MIHHAARLTLISNPSPNFFYPNLFHSSSLPYSTISTPSHNSLSWLISFPNFDAPANLFIISSILSLHSHADHLLSCIWLFPQFPFQDILFQSSASGLIVLYLHSTSFLSGSSPRIHFYLTSFLRYHQFNFLRITFYFVTHCPLFHIQPPPLSNRLYHQFFLQTSPTTTNSTFSTYTYSFS